MESFKKQFKHIIFVVIAFSLGNVFAAPSSNSNVKRIYIGDNTPSKTLAERRAESANKSDAKTVSKKRSTKKVASKTRKRVVAKKSSRKTYAKSAKKKKASSVLAVAVPEVKSDKESLSAISRSKDPVVVDSSSVHNDSILLQEEDKRLSMLESDSNAVQVEEDLPPQLDLANANGDGFSINHVGPFLNTTGNKYYEILPSGEKVVLTIDRNLQMEAEKLLKSFNLPYSALVAMEPSSGKILALTASSNTIPNGVTLTAQSSFPAASLFKMITASAAVEKVGLNSNSTINYRGGTYSLGKHNYLPNAKSDKLKMTLGKAMGKSCNPVFARVAINYLSTGILKQYASSFGFGKNLAYDFPVNKSTINLPNDKYNLARTAAGFGEVFISPVHAASIVAAIGNDGMMMRPYIVDGVMLRGGKVRNLNNSKAIGQVVTRSTSKEIVEMMESTITEGTARKRFRIASPELRRISIAGKTGTLSGKNPKGIYHWFTAVAPTENPTIAISALVIDNGTARVNGVGLGRRLLEKYFDKGSLTESAKVTSKNSRKPVS